MIKIESFLENSRLRSAEAGRPVITLSYAQSLDGCLGVVRGQRTAMSGLQAMQLTHSLRAAHQAILIGIGTVLADDPQLTVRLVQGPNPISIVVDTNLRIPDDCNLLQRRENEAWIIYSREASPARQEILRKKGVHLIPCERKATGQIDLHAALKTLLQSGIETLMVEGGARILTSFLVERLFDQAVITVCPFWLGGLPSVAENLRQDANFPGLASPAYTQMGDDLVVYGKRKEISL